MILTFCSRWVLDAEAAVNLTAETVAQAFGSRRGFRGSELEARAWLLTIARRRAGHRDRLRACAVPRAGPRSSRLPPTWL